MPEVTVLSNSKIPSEFLQAISWRPKKSGLVLISMSVMLLTSFKMGRIRLGRRMIENRGIVAAVEIDVGFDEEMICEHAASISEEDFQNAALASLQSAHDERLQGGGHRETGGGQ